MSDEATRHPPPPAEGSAETSDPRRPAPAEPAGPSPALAALLKQSVYASEEEGASPASTQQGPRPRTNEPAGPSLFAEHDAYHKTSLRLLLGGAAGGVLAYLLALGLPGLTMAALITAATLTLGGAAAAHRVAGAKGAALGALYFAAIAASPQLFPGRPTFAALAAGAALGFGFFRIRHRESSRGGARPGQLSLLASSLTSAGALLLGQHALQRLMSRGVMEDLLPELLAAGAYGAFSGLFLALGAAGSHAAPEPDPVEVAYARAVQELTGEFRVLSSRAIEAYRQAQLALDGTDAPARRQLSANLSAVTTRALDLARRWQQVERDMGGAAEGELVKRLTELRRLKEGTPDETARRQYQIAEKTLEDQLAQVGRIRIGRERVMAKLHGQMAVLESTRFALVGMRSADAHRAAADLSGLSHGLATIARELDAEAEAINEVHSGG